MRGIWFSRRAIGLHAVIVVIVPTFAALCAWQVSRALSGNELSWAYVFEWPFFAGYAVYMWWRFVHEAPSAGSGTGADPGTPAPTTQVLAAADDADPDAEDLAAYNRYLSDLAAHDKRTPSG